MLTLAEAHQRLQVNNMRLSGNYRQYRVSFNECDGSLPTYKTDDLEDAVIEAGRMRRNRTQELSGSR